MLSPVAFNRFYKSLFVRERLIATLSPHLSLFGLKKLRGWRNLRGFRQAPLNFKSRLGFDQLSIYSLSNLLGQKTVIPKKNVELSWLVDAINYDRNKSNASEWLTRFPELNEYSERGIITPFLFQVIKSIEKITKFKNITDFEVNLFLKNELAIIEQLIRRAFILELNICEIQGVLAGDNKALRYKSFTNQFILFENRLNFFQKYPVLFRTVVNNLDQWAQCTHEFLTRLESDRVPIENIIGIPKDAKLKSIMVSGDTHNNGRSVFVIEFTNNKFLIYKPRNTSMELSFQKYLEFFNAANSDLKLRCIGVLDRGVYGWVEYVPFIEQSSQAESDIYHYRLGFLNAIVFSINGVDIFFENLIASGPDPVIIDLETMFHTSIDTKSNKGPVNALQLSLYDSIAGIGILPQPNQGATEAELFDISVMGAKKDARAPYNVSGVENFGCSDMRITEISGWINENKASSDDNFSHARKVSFLFDGLKDGLNFLLKNKELLGRNGGVIDKCFINSRRRLIVRDTKIYGALQNDEAHPDLLRDQIDREWHWDNLWSDVLERPNLTLFIQSELSQLKQGDIPYFSGAVDSLSVTGGDGMTIDLSLVLDLSPIQLVKNKLLSLCADVIENQIRIASTTLGLCSPTNFTQPLISSNKEAIVNAISIGNFLRKRISTFDGRNWCDTSINPVPKYQAIDPVRITPCDPFLYDGILGIAMFFDDLHRQTGDKNFYNASKDLVSAVFSEIEINPYYSLSGFAGLSSIVYVVNRSATKDNSSFVTYESKLESLLKLIEAKIEHEKQLDFLLGISGIACALLPYASRTASKSGNAILRSLLARLTTAGHSILDSKRPIQGMDYLRGLSHGITGISLSLHRLGEFFKNEDANNLASNLLLHEYALVKDGKWTDSHTYGGDQLVGWCHGSAGIALALSYMPKIVEKSKLINDYYHSAASNTLLKGVYQSKCLCHGTGGNILCLRRFIPEEKKINKLSNQFRIDLVTSGFSSMGVAQTMGVGLMTGLTGAGYHLLGANDQNFDYDFLTLA